MRGAGIVHCASRMNARPIDSGARADFDADMRPERWWHRHRRLVGGVGALAATALAATWLVVVPGEAAEAVGLQRFLLQYAHSICWGLIAIALAGIALRAPRILIDGCAWAALAAYVAFLSALAL